MRFATALLQSGALCGLLILFNSSGVAQNRASPVGIGEKAPDFTLESHQGTKITLSEAYENSPVVLVFYRGYW
jgi:hypothetical protein